MFPISDASSDLHQSDETKFSAIVANLLLQLGEIHENEMPMLIGTTVETGISIGRILVMCRRLTEAELQSALTAASLVLAGQISLTRAAIILAYSYLWHVDFESLWQRDEWQKSGSVAIFLMVSGALDTKKLRGLISMLPPDRTISGRDLHRSGLVSLSLWQESLNQALLVKRGLLSLRQLLCQADDACVTDELPVVEDKAEEKVQLGELLVHGGMVSTSDLLCALETSLEREELLGMVLIERRIVSQEILTTVLRLQALIMHSTISKGDAISYLRQVALPRALDEISLAA